MAINRREFLEERIWLRLSNARCNARMLSKLKFEEVLPIYESECIGLQLYYPQHDLFEIDRMLDRFTAFGKLLHISEISCSSAEGEDASSMRPHSITPGWHGPWTEASQADWLEAVYTLCYSKPEFDAVGYWDLADGGVHFWPHGGLLRKDLTPKESYHRLFNLKKSWGLA